MPAPDERIKSQLGKFNLDTEYLPIFFAILEYITTRVSNPLTE
jgi:hypothetical protein